MANELDERAERSLNPNTPQQNAAEAYEARQEYDENLQEQFQENLKDKRIGGFQALGMGTVAAATDEVSPIYLGAVGAAQAVDWAYQGAVKGTNVLADVFLNKNGMGPHAQDYTDKQIEDSANLGLAQTTAKFLDGINKRANDVTNLKPGILNRALYDGAWLTGEAATFNFIGKGLKAEELASQIASKAEFNVPWARHKLSNLFGKVASEEVAKKTSEAFMNALPRALAYGAGYTASQVASDIVSGRKDKTLPELAHVFMGNTMAIAGFEMAPWGLGVALPAAVKGTGKKAKKLWDGFVVNLMNPSEAAVAGEKFFDTALKTNVNNGAPYIKSAVAANIKKLTPDVISKLRWHFNQYSKENAEITERQYKIIDELGKLPKEDLHKASLQDLKEAAEVFKVLKDNSPEKYERWNKFDLENHINEALPDHGAYKSVGKVIEGEGWDLSATEQANYAQTARALSSPVKELEYINERYLSRPKSLSKDRLKKIKSRAAALRTYLKTKDRLAPERLGVSEKLPVRLEGERYYNHPMAELLRELNQSEDSFRKNSNQISGLDAILNGDWDEGGQNLEDAVTSHILSENTPPKEPTYEEQIKTATSKEAYEATDTPIPDEGGAEQELEATKLSNLSEETQQEFKDKVDSLKEQEQNHPSFTRMIDDATACVIGALKGRP